MPSLLADVTDFSSVTALAVALSTEVHLAYSNLGLTIMCGDKLHCGISN